MPLTSTVARTALHPATPAAPRTPVHAPARPETVPATLGDHLLIPLAGGVAQYANLDHAASTPALVGVKSAVDRALATYSSVHRGNGYASRVTSRWYEEARAEVATFVGARPDDNYGMFVLRLFWAIWCDDGSERVTREQAEEIGTTISFARRMAHETSMHRWDADNAQGDPAPIDPELAIDGIDEALGTYVAARFDRERFGAAQAFCRVPRAPVGWTGSPPLRVRLCAVAAYDLGAISVEYFHEDMQRSGRSPYRFARPSRR